MKFVDTVQRAPHKSPFIAPEALAAASGTPLRLRLGANESEFGPSPKALAAIRAASETVSYYGDPVSMELTEQISKDLAVKPRNLSFESGIDGLLSLIARTFLEEGDCMVQSRGGYPVVSYVCRPLGAQVVGPPYREDGTTNLNALLEYARRFRAKLIYLSNPDNPSGSFVAAEELQAFIDSLPLFCTLVLDEAYVDFAPQSDVLPIVERPNVIRLRTFSKAYGLAGARMGFAIAPTEVIEQFDKLRMHFNLNRLAQAGALAAWRDRDYLVQTVNQVRSAREHLYALADSLGTPYLPSSTNFVCIDAQSDQRSQKLVDELLKEGVFIRRPWDEPLSRFVRVTAGTQEQMDTFSNVFSKVWLKV